ncbi:MAG: biotin carboxylase N-terminal domain-containing protein [bacterium]
MVSAKIGFSNFPILIGNRSVIAGKALRTMHGMGIPVILPYTALEGTSNGNVVMPWLLNKSLFLSAHEIPKYSDPKRLVALAKETQCKAFYPGYGFLSEDPVTAAAFEAEGIKWIGPSSDILRIFGDKMVSRKLAEKLGVPVIPGHEFSDVREANILAGNLIRQAKLRDISLDMLDSSPELYHVTAEDWKKYPIRVKAVAAGGGRGQVVVYAPEKLLDAIRQAKHDVKNNARLDNDQVFLELDIPRAKHWEVQIVGDGINVVHMGCRICYMIPGKHQKIIEEGVNPQSEYLSVREKQIMREMIEAAITIMREVKYAGLGTVEFIVDDHGRWYFLEVNPRIQVEHGPTEFITRVHNKTVRLIEEQVKIAAGIPLAYRQKDISFEGSAIQGRLLSINPETITAYPNTFTQFVTPVLQEGILWLEDAGLSYGFRNGLLNNYSISTNYDPMFGKFVSWAIDRLSAIDGLRLGLSQFEFGKGVRTSIPFILKVISHPEFRSSNTAIWAEFPGVILRGQ